MKSSAVCFDDQVTLFLSSRRRILHNDRQSFVKLPRSSAIRSVQCRFFFATNSTCLRWSDAKKTERSLSVLVRRYRLSSLQQAQRVARHSASNHGECGRTRLRTSWTGAKRSAMLRSTVSYSVNRSSAFSDGDGARPRELSLMACMNSERSIFCQLRTRRVTGGAAQCRDGRVHVKRLWSEVTPAGSTVRLATP